MQDATSVVTLDLIQKDDCTTALSRLPGGFVDLAFADPPFNIGYSYDVYNDTKDRNDYIEWSKHWISAVYRVLKGTGAFWLAIGDEYAAELKIVSQDVGFHCRSWVVWYYTFGVNCTRKFTRSHAHLFYFVKDPSAFTFRGDDLENRIPSARQLVYADARANPRGRLPDDTWLLRPQDLAGCLTPQEDTWYFPRVAGTFKERAGFHGCQMPEQLLGRIIRTCSNRGDLVLDPFSGSATTLVVAKKLGRRYMGIEISDEYVRRGTDRLAAVRLDDPLEGAPEPTLSVPCTPVPGTAFRKRRHRSKSAQRRPSERHVNDSAIDCAPAVQDGLISAFRSTHGGYSLDRLIADPDVNDRFVEACCKLGLPGDARSWNRLLLRMRKAGKLAEVATRERTDFHWDDCDPYLFASEIALQQILNRGCESVDALLCDPFTSTEFDRLAQSLAPGFSSLQFRWATLKLRKEAKLARARTRVLTPVRLGPPIPLSELDFRSIPQVAGVYLVTGTGGKPKLYAGGTLNLCRRLSCKFSAPLLTQWRQQWSADLILLATLPESGAADVLAYQYLLAREHRPSLNCLEFADGDENGRQRFDRSQVDSKRKNRKRSESRSMSFHG